MQKKKSDDFTISIAQRILEKVKVIRDSIRRSSKKRATKKASKKASKKAIKKVSKKKESKRTSPIKRAKEIVKKRKK